MMTLTIGKLAQQAQVNVETVRYYERRGLIPPPRRTPSGYRQYNGDAVARLRFIKRAQDMGFTLVEIAELLALRVRSASACSAVERKAREKITKVEAKIRDLEHIKLALDRLVESCRRGTRTGECPIIDALEGVTIDG